MSGEIVDDLLVKGLLGQLDDLERRHLARWSSESPGNAAYAEQLSRLWDLVDRALPAAPRPAASTIVRAAHERFHPRRRVLWWSAGVAAVITVGFLANFILRPGPVAPVQSDFVAGSQAPVTLSLEDGSIVRLAPGSRLHFTVTGGERSASLIGTA